MNTQSTNSTSAVNVSRRFSEAEWNGHRVMLETDPLWPLCEALQHDVRQMHHYGPDGRDWGPTGFLECSRCTGICDEPEDRNV